MNPRRILIFSLAYYPRFVGGAEVAVKEITDRISASEIEFDMITLRKHAPAFERIGNVNVYRVGMPWFGANTKSSRIFPLSKILFPFFAAYKAFALHKKQNYGAIWPIMASYAGFAALMFKKFHPAVPMILTIQEGDHFERRKGILKPFFRAIFQNASQIQCISNFLADWSKEMGATCPITVVPNAVDYELFSKKISDDESHALKAKLGKQKDDVLLVTTSRLVAKNAIGDVIETLRYVPENVKFLIIGVGALEKELKAKVANLKLESRVMFRGYVEYKNLPPYLQVSDIFIRPSISEGFGNSFIEAMAAGIPVIATPVGGIPDFLTDGETGLFCEVDNPRSIAQKVEKLMKDRESRDYIVSNAKIIVEEKYQWKTIAEDMKKIFIKD